MSQRMTQDAELGRALADIVEEAGAEILPLWKSELAVDRKADLSPVTEADRRGEALILRRLAERFPGVAVVSEEDACEFGTPDEIGARFFLVDPLDGTKAFVRGDEHWTVNIGLIQDGRPVAGAVCAPAWDRTWLTTAKGAQRRRIGDTEGELIRVRPWPESGAVALVSHTMKPDVEAELRLKYGQDLHDRRRRGRHLSAPRHDHGMGHRRRPRRARSRRRQPRDPGWRALPLRQGRRRLQERLVRRPGRVKVVAFAGMSGLVFEA
jgi:3'(2'), 5'-bisphosphate nucleotidase